MENSKLATLQAKRDELIRTIKDKQKEIDCFDVSLYYSEDMFIDEMHEAFGYIDIMGIQYSAVHTLRKIDYIAFREMFNNYLDTLDKNDFDEYQALDEELEELENELLEIEEQTEQLENE